MQLSSHLNPWKINGRIAPIRPFLKLWVLDQPRAVPPTVPIRFQLASPATAAIHRQLTLMVNACVLTPP
jgi:hypothetical protein